MQKSFDKNRQKRTGQVRDERSVKKERGGHVRGKRGESAERVNGAPVYTAIYKVNRSDELMEFLLRKCGTSRNNVNALILADRKLAVRLVIILCGRVTHSGKSAVHKEASIGFAEYLFCLYRLVKYGLHSHIVSVKLGSPYHLTHIGKKNERASVVSEPYSLDTRGISKYGS